MLVAILGLPGSGKTTLANKLANALNLTVLHTDDFKSMPWSKAADAAMAAIANGTYGVVEGITVARLFRRGFEPSLVLVLAGGKPMPAMSSLISRGLREYRGVRLHLVGRPPVSEVLAYLSA